MIWPTQAGKSRGEESNLVEGTSIHGQEANLASSSVERPGRADRCTGSGLQDFGSYQPHDPFRLTTAKTNDIQFTDNTASRSRVRFVGSSDIGNGMKAGVRSGNRFCFQPLRYREGSNPKGD